MRTEARKFSKFAFQQLKRIPVDWQPHYRHLLLNGMYQSDFENSPDKGVSSRPLYWELNEIRKGYHGVKWVLSRFNLECHNIPEMFSDSENEIHTNETVGNVYETFTSNAKFMSIDDPYLKPRTISEAEQLIISSSKTSDLERGLGYLEEEHPHRVLDHDEMDDYDLQDEDMDEAAFGGTIWGQGKGYPPGMTGEHVEFDPIRSTWHSNTTREIDKKAVEKYRISGYKGDETHLKSSSERKKYDKARVVVLDRQELESDNGISLRWVRKDGKWIRNKTLPETPEELYSHPSPPGIGNDY